MWFSSKARLKWTIIKRTFHRLIICNKYIVFGRIDANHLNIFIYPMHSMNCFFKCEYRPRHSQPDKFQFKAWIIMKSKNSNPFPIKRIDFIPSLFQCKNLEEKKKINSIKRKYSVAPPIHSSFHLTFCGDCIEYLAHLLFLVESIKCTNILSFKYFTKNGDDNQQQNKEEIA